MKRPILIITIGYITGNILGLYFNIAPFVFLFLIIIFLIFKNISFNINNNYMRVLMLLIKNNIVLTFLISAFISSMYLNYCDKKYERVYNNFNANEIIGTVISNNKESEYKNIYKIKLEEFNNINLILRISKSKKIILEYGDKIKIKGEYNIPDASRNYGAFDYRQYLKTQKIYGVFEADKVEKIKYNNLSFINIFTNIVKLKIIEKFNKILPKDTSQLFLGILIGYDDYLSEEIQESFNKSSLTHLLAVSGSHIVYIISGITFLFRIFKIPKRITNIIIAMFLIFFMCITDFTASVVRASLMGIIFVLALVLFRKNDVKTTISISILLILLENPYKILDIGLLLSYFATIGIICLSTFIRSKKVELSLKEKVIKCVKELVLITVFANIFVMPIIVYNFNTISLTFVISNLIAGILIGPITIGGFILIVISFINIKFAYIISIPYNLLLKLLILSTKITSLIPLSEILVPTPNIWFIITYYIILFMYISYIYINKEFKNRFLVKKVFKYIRKILITIKQKYRSILVLVVTFLFLINLVINLIPKNLKIYFIDVGQGDSSLIITPTNKKILIDSGGAENEDYDVGKNVLLPYLLDRKILSIDYICISHFDSDHCEGFKYLLNSIKVKNIIVSKQYEATENFKEIIKLAQKNNINILIVKEGDILKIDKEVQLKILNPGKILTDDINNNSIVAKLMYMNFCCLFTGDISKNIEEDLIKKYRKELECSVLKVAHHGSNTSSEEGFIKSINPKIALIGVGKNNKFGHPSREVIESINSINSKIYRTDINGEIILNINKKRYDKSKYSY